MFSAFSSPAISCFAFSAFPPPSPIGLRTTRKYSPYIRPVYTGVEECTRIYGPYLRVMCIGV